MPTTFPDPRVRLQFIDRPHRSAPPEPPRARAGGGLFPRSVRFVCAWIGAMALAGGAMNATTPAQEAIAQQPRGTGGEDPATMVPVVPELHPLAIVADWYGDYLHPVGDAAAGPRRGMPSPLDPEAFEVLDQLLTGQLLEAVRHAMGTDAGVAGTLGFDPWINGQDFDLGGVTLKAGPAAAGEAQKSQVVAEVANFGAVSRVTFDFLQGTDGRWRLAEVHGKGPGDDGGSWQLSELLGQP